LPEPSLFFAGVHRILRPGGKLFLYHIHTRKLLNLFMEMNSGGFHSSLRFKCDR
jgi:hypothetical protein